MIVVKEKNITVLGAARSGMAAAQLLHNSGANVFISDSAAEDKKTAEIAELTVKHIEFEFGGHSDRAFQTDFVVLSPGVPVRSPVVQKFIKMGIPVYSEIEIAASFCKAPIIGITGSNGKTTTTTLLGEMLKKKYEDAIVAGNIGQPFSAYVENSHPDTVAAVEISSFQLETIDAFHPRTAMILNFSENHLDRYDSYEDYIQAKWRITKNLTKDDLFIFNAGDRKLCTWTAQLSAVKQGFSIDGDQKQAAYFDGTSIYIAREKLIDTNEMVLRGPHNYMNAMAASLAAKNAGVSNQQMREVLAVFSGVEHRLELVAIIDGVTYINDSKATTVDSLMVALQSFDAPIILIAGGKDKGSDFSRLNQLISKKVKAAVLIGSATKKIATTWQGIKPIHHADSMEDAVEKAGSLTENGDVVLLSPACASFDMFSDYEDRGRKFKSIVNELRKNR